MTRITRWALLLSALLGACGDDTSAPVDGGTMDTGTMDGGADAASDACEGVDAADRCTANVCDGATLIACVPNENGCMVQEPTNCAALPGGTCSEGACVSETCGPGPSCTEGRRCEGNALITCAPDVRGCPVETRVECMDAACGDRGGIPACLSECTDECDTETRTCDGNTLVRCERDASGCLVETTSPCGAGEVCEGGACAAGSCELATAELNCDTGTLMGSTVDGSTRIRDYACGPDDGYTGLEKVFAFSDPRAARVTITATRLSGTADMDLFVLDGDEGCGPSATCLDFADGRDEVEVVSFDSLPDDLAYVVYDSWGFSLPIEYRFEVSCEISECGDGVTVGIEGCDDGNDMAGDGCSERCQVEDGYACSTDGDGLSVCALTCGDGFITGDDECDDMNDVDGDGCTDCTIDSGFTCAGAPSECVPSCGNGVIDGDDVCDDNNDVAGDGCTDCRIDEGYTCTDEPSLCELECGNGRVAGDDVCDDGNLASGDGCSATCTPEAGFACVGSPSLCASIVFTERGTLADDDTAWTRPDGSSDRSTRAGCSADDTDTVFDSVVYTNTSGTTQLLTAIGEFAFDSYLFAYEGAVDPATPLEGCIDGEDDRDNVRWALIPFLEVGAGESIVLVVSSFRSDRDHRGAWTVSLVEAGLACGDGDIRAGVDMCDDGDLDGGDGCSSQCAIESGFVCSGEPSECRAVVCGDGMIEGDEACDDGDVIAGDGCSASCVIEDEHTCRGEPSECVFQRCGNGLVEGTEVCDGDAGCAADCFSATFSGALTTMDGVWDRPNQACNLDDDGSSYRFDVQRFAWRGGAAELAFAVQWTDVDGYLHAYDAPFTATAPTVGCIDGNDDFRSDRARSEVRIDASSAADFDIVLSTFDEDALGSWVLTVTQP